MNNACPRPKRRNTHPAPSRSIGGRSRPGSRVELRPSSCRSHTSATVHGWGESMCGVLLFVSYLHNVHGPQRAVWSCRLLLPIVRCENVGGHGAHETVLDSHDVAFDHECLISTCPGHVVCMLGQLCCSVSLLAVKLCCGTASTCLQTV